MHLTVPTRDISRWSVYNECTNAEDKIIDWLNLSLSTEHLIFTQLLLPGSVIYDGGRVLHVALLHLFLKNGAKLKDFQRLRNQSDKMQMLKMAIFLIISLPIRKEEHNNDWQLQCKYETSIHTFTHWRKKISALVFSSHLLNQIILLSISPTHYRNTFLVWRLCYGKMH